MHNLKKINKAALEPWKMYLWRMSGGSIRPVWLCDDDPNYFDEWDQGGRELAVVTGDFFGPVELED